MEWYEIVIGIASGIATAIPLAIKLVEWVKIAIQEKNWNNLLNLVMSLMAEAEKNFATGAERREWVLNMVKASASTINYEIDLEQVGQLIDSLCAMSKVVNHPASEEACG